MASSQKGRDPLHIDIIGFEEAELIKLLRVFTYVAAMSYYEKCRLLKMAVSTATLLCKTRIDLCMHGGWYHRHVCE